MEPILAGMLKACLVQAYFRKAYAIGGYRQTAKG